MNNEVILKLMEIEEEVQSIAETAMQKQYELPQRIHNKCEEIEAELQKEYDEKISSAVSTIKKDVDIKIENLKKEKLEKIKFMDENYEKNHSIWEEEIFKQIIGG